MRYPIVIGRRVRLNDQGRYAYAERNWKRWGTVAGGSRDAVTVSVKWDGLQTKQPVWIGHLTCWGRPR